MLATGSVCGLLVYRWDGTELVGVAHSGVYNYNKATTN